MEEKNRVKGVKELDNGDLEVTTKDGVFVMTDPVSDEMTRAIKRNKGSEIYGILSAMIIKVNGEEKNLGELTIKKFRSSSILKMQTASDILMGGDDFLPEETSLNQTVSTE